MRTTTTHRRRAVWVATTIVVVFGASVRVAAHEEGAPFSGAIIDPLSTHHAHLEDEQRLNMFFLKGFKDASGNQRFAFANELELAWASRFTIGAEMFVPFSNGSRDGQYNLGDIEIQPMKYSFLRHPETVATVVMAAVLPSGSVKQGLGEGRTTLEPRVLLDQAFGNWYVGSNLIPAVSVTGSQRVGLEYQFALAYSFISGTRDMAPPKPEQPWVLSPSLEVVGNSTFRGEEEGRTELSLLPGLMLWHTHSGWQVRAGILLPLRAARESDFVEMLQFGNHLNWGSLL